MAPPFPEPGSAIGLDSKYFCLGRLGKGTFCSIHKCVDLSYSHSDSSSDTVKSDAAGSVGGAKKTRPKQRIVAAKAELANFVDSGVIDGEAAVLKFLDFSLPEGMVPRFEDYVRQHPPSMHTGGGTDSMASDHIRGISGGGAGPGSAGAGTNGIPDERGGVGGISAIMMEYLPGEDMHLLRDRHCQSISAAAAASMISEKEIGNLRDGGVASSATGAMPRRVSIADAVYLVADVMLPLLKAMHNVGMVHRDVKPSNVVRIGTNDSNRKFKIVDFGLSKSFVVPKDSPFADVHRPWEGRWMSPSFTNSIFNSGGNSNQLPSDEPEDMLRGGCVRLERDYAEFRGTSMYASLRVHQGKDHCPRDDVWGLLYVFCDLVSGGLPWMSHAAARDRASCQILKEMVLGERGIDDWGDCNGTGGVASVPNPGFIPQNGEDAIKWLLFGAEYHMAKFKHDLVLRSPGRTSVASSLTLPEPLSISKNEHYVECLRKAFRHVASLGFVEMPNYDFIDECLRGFLDNSLSKDSVPPIDWNDRRLNKRRRTQPNKAQKTDEAGGVSWIYLDPGDMDPLDDLTLMEAEADRRVAIEAAAVAAASALDDAAGGMASTVSSSAACNGVASVVANQNLDHGVSLSGEAADLARLPLQMQFRLSQAEYNARHPETIPIYLALRDWMALALPLAHETWDAASWERGNHRTQDDGYRNEVYMSMLEKCLEAATPFGGFTDMNCYYYPNEWSESKTETKRKRRLCAGTTPQPMPGNSDIETINMVNESPLVVVSRVFFSLRLALDLERNKTFAPPPKLSFGFGRPGMAIGA